MKKNLIVLIMILLIPLVSCDNDAYDPSSGTNAKGSDREMTQTDPIQKEEDAKKESVNSVLEQTEIKVTFIELGSVKCIPCKKMQPIIKEIEEEYKDVKVVFYDVWTPQGKPYAQKYRIRLIPTQVFLDKDGNEYYRHAGFFSKEEIIKILQKKGVK